MRAPLLALLFASVAFAQDDVSRRLDRVFGEEAEKTRAAVLDDLRRELGRPAAAAAPAGTIDAAKALVTAEVLRAHATYLADDALEGRAAGYPGNDKAGEYVAGVFKAAGLKPAGDEGAYFQKFKVGARDTRNVVGVIEGTDPKLKDEIVVVGAHYDHVGTADQKDYGRLGGRGGDDKIWNGADDNGSGTSTLLGVAKAFGEGGLKAKRTIVFIAFSGEEAGLIGSAYYCRKPYGTIEKHAYMLNLDMVGRNPQKPIELHGVGSAEGGVLRKVAERAVAASGLKATLNDGVKLVGGDSDHSSFRDKRVPYSFFFSGFHADYHRPSDTAEKLAYDNMVKVAHTSVDILLDVANLEERPRFVGTPGPRFNLPGAEEPQGPAPRRLGVTVQELDDAECDGLGLVAEQGGLRVDLVQGKTVSEAAGMKNGDVILEVAGEKLPRGTTRDKLKDVLANKVKPGREIEIVVLRGGNKTTLKATFDK
ncbi:MAG TPA: M28 family peptidase [Planctomycetota bacterium]